MTQSPLTPQQPPTPQQVDFIRNTEPTQPATYYPKQPSTPPPPAPKPKRAKRFGWIALGVAALSGLLLGRIVGGAGDSTTTVAAPAPTATVTATKPAPTSAAATKPPEPTKAPAGYEPKLSDWNVKVKITDKQCFGSAGCSIDYSITPQYVGTQDLPTEGVIEVTYEITGDEDPIIGSFTVEDDNVQYDKEGFMSTPRSSTKVRSSITDVEYDKEG